MRDRDAGEGREDAPEAPLRFVEVGYSVVHERDLGHGLPAGAGKRRADAVQRRRDGAGAQAHEKDGVAQRLLRRSIVHADQHRRDRVAKRVQMLVRHDAHDRHLASVVKGERAPDGLGRRPPSEIFHRRRVEHDGACSVARPAVQVAASQQARSERGEIARLRPDDARLEVHVFLVDGEAVRRAGPGRIAVRRDGLRDAWERLDGALGHLERLRQPGTLEIDRDEAVGGISGVLRLGIPDLPQHDGRPRKQPDRDDELHHDERLPQPARASRREIATQRRHRPHPGQHQRRIHAGDEAREERQPRARRARTMRRGRPRPGRTRTGR